MAAPPLAPGAWWGDYFANRTLSGSPALSRYDDAVNFNWGTGSPGSGVPADNFSVRWTRDEWFTGGTYRFTTNALEQAPSGGASAADVADAVWDEPIADHVQTGSTGKKLSDVTGGTPVNIDHESTVIVT